jgi:hypothetical protein
MYIVKEDFKILQAGNKYVTIRTQTGKEFISHPKAFKS